MENQVELLRKRLSDLYKELFKVEGEEAQIIQEEIDKLLVKTNNLTAYTLFSSKMYKKSFMRTLKQLKQGDNVSDIELAKAMSSSITHSIIDMEREGSTQYTDLYIPEQANLLYLFLLGEVTKEQVREFYSELK